MSNNNDGCLGYGCLIIMIPISVAILLLIYGLAVIILRAAFGIELPNPVDWLPDSWREYIPRS